MLTVTFSGEFTGIYVCYRINLFFVADIIYYVFLLKRIKQNIFPLLNAYCGKR